MPSVPTEPYNNEMRGVLFPNENKRTEKSPDMTGKCQINGKEFRLAGWTQQTREGTPYLSLSVTDPETQIVESQTTVATKLPF